MSEFKIADKWKDSEITIKSFDNSLEMPFDLRILNGNDDNDTIYLSVDKVKELVSFLNEKIAVVESKK